MALIPFLINLVIVVAVIGILISIFRYAMSKFGFTIEPALMSIIYAILGLVFLVWFLNAVLPMLGYSHIIAR